MRRSLVIAALLMSTVALAALLKTFSWTNATQYENGAVLPPSDIFTTIHCGITSGGPYEVEVGASLDGDVSAQLDVQPLIDQYGTTTFYCVARHNSIQYQTISADSGEVNFTVTPSDAGFVPNPPTNLTIQ